MNFPRLRLYAVGGDSDCSREGLRDALGLVEGDQVVFRVEGRRALLARTPNLLDLAGSVPVPAQKRGTRWPEIRRRTREARAKTRA